MVERMLKDMYIVERRLKEAWKKLERSSKEAWKKVQFYSFLEKDGWKKEIKKERN